MFAIIKSGGKQYKVRENMELKIEKIEKSIGTQIEFTAVLMLQESSNIKIGNPTVKNAKVIAEIVSHGRNKKVQIIKFRRRKSSMNRAGHRQYFTAIKIKEILS